MIIKKEKEIEYFSEVRNEKPRPRAPPAVLRLRHICFTKEDAKAKLKPLKGKGSFCHYDKYSDAYYIYSERE